MATDQHRIQNLQTKTMSHPIHIRIMRLFTETYLFTAPNSRENFHGRQFRHHPVSKIGRAPASSDSNEGSDEREYRAEPNWDADSGVGPQAERLHQGCGRAASPSHAPGPPPYGRRGKAPSP